MPPFKQVLSEDQTRQMLVFLRDGAARLAESPPFVPSPDGVEIESNKLSFRIELLVSGLNVPWGLDFLPDGRKLVTERTGYLRIINANGNLLPQPVSGMPQAYVVQDGGYLDVAVDPDYEHNCWIYISYVEALSDNEMPEQADLDTRDRQINPPMNIVVIRGRINKFNEWVDGEVLFRAEEDMYTTSGVHFGSRFLFDNQDHLYFSMGDRGQPEYAQDLSSPNGKIHRIYKDGSIPEDNPFVDVDGALPSIWSYGHRNPQGLAWDPYTGLMWESEHGPTGGDEINIIEPGKNYGWAEISMGLQPGIETSSAPGMEQPIVHYTPAIAPSGISFLDADREIYPQWNTSLFVSGLSGQQLRRLEIDGRQVVEQEVLFNQFGRTREVAQGPDGYIYALMQNPTGSHVGTRLSAVTPGVLVRLLPSGE
jgi:glucose/arabinose dehydrogenase